MSKNYCINIRVSLEEREALLYLVKKEQASSMSEMVLAPLHSFMNTKEWRDYYGET